MIQYLILTILLIQFSCDSKQRNSSEFEIAKIDKHKGKLQRIFVVVRPEKVNDTLFIGKVIGKLKNSYKIEKNSNISFFSTKKYADYKTELFMNNNHTMPTTEYENWRNSYLGEYEFETNIYKTYPISNLTKKQNEFKLKGSPHL